MKIISCPHSSVSTIFLDKNDGVRNQMASLQCRQALPLLEAEPPIVVSTLERHPKMPDILRAKERCELVYDNHDVIVTRSLESSTYTIHLIDHQYQKPRKKIFEKGEIITHKKYFFSENGTLQQGRNLLTAIVTHPWCYEDSLVVRKDCGMTSVHWRIIEKDIKEHEILLNINKGTVFPQEGQTFEAGTPILRIKDSSPHKLLEDPIEISLNEDCKIVQVKVIANKWNDSLRDYYLQVKDTVFTKERMKEALYKIIEDKDIAERVRRLSGLFLPGESKNNKEKFDLYIKIVCETHCPLEPGDKLSNRHANKGVISKFEDVIFLTEDERKIDIVTDLMSVISRMNVGQIYEAIASSSIYYLKKKIKDMDITEAKEFVKEFYTIIDNTETKFIIKRTTQFLESIETIEELVNSRMEFPAPPFETPTPEQIMRLSELLNPEIFYNLKNTDFTPSKSPEDLPRLYPILEKLYDPTLDQWFYGTCGYVYWYKLVHRAAEKVAGRSIGKIDKRTLQPISGRSKMGGQRFGEMETWALLSFDAIENLREINMKSDDISEKTKFIISEYFSSDMKISHQKNEARRLLDAYLKILHIEI